MTSSEWQERMNELKDASEPFLSPDSAEQTVTEDYSINTLDEFRQWFEPFKDVGCFRGHTDATWNLNTTFDRAVEKSIIHTTTEVQFEMREHLATAEDEQAVLLKFKRGAHNYTAHTPAPDEAIDWLALMQHYGAPTRLLDWTRSPYVALYFAIQSDSKQDGALWAIDMNWLQSRSNEGIGQQDKNFSEKSDFRTRYEYVNSRLFHVDNPTFIVQADPMRENQRMLAQQGQLLCCLRNGVSFSECILRMLIHPFMVKEQVVSKVRVKKDNRINLLDDLRRMNIHSASLFPGLAGFAKSIGEELDITVDRPFQARKRVLAEMLTGISINMKA
jgi:hypothetical protein